MNKLLATSLATLSLLAARPARADEPHVVVVEPPKAHADFKEPGRFGLIGAITDDGFQFGVARAAEHYEGVVTVDASYAPGKGNAGGSGDMGVTLRAAPRAALGNLNYLSVGGQFHTNFFSHDAGVDTKGSYSFGPYLSVQRNFAGTPLMISLWVLPYQFSHDVSADAGKRSSLNNHEFFQGGGFGLTYLL